MTMVVVQQTFFISIKNAFSKKLNYILLLLSEGSHLIINRFSLNSRR